MKRILFFLLCLICIESGAQYIGVKAKYTETRLVDDSPNPPKRENRLILSFYEVSFNGTENVWTPVALSNYDIWVYKMGLQYGSNTGGVLDSTGNNYPGYSYTAPKAVSYYNTLGLNYVDCDTYSATHYVVNGHTLDVGFITVSYWDVDWGTMQPYEAFPAPNVLLPYYDISHPYYFAPGNVNFDWSAGFPGPPYNMYNFFCGTGVLNLVMRGVLAQDTGNSNVVLPVRFANVRGEIRDSNITIGWSNLTEIDIAVYDIEKSADGINWVSMISVLPLSNNGSRADYFQAGLQTEERCYYRIKATETTGQFFYSHVIVLRKNSGPTIPQEAIRVLSVDPNPETGDQFTFRLTNAEKGRYISMILSADGKQLKQKMIEHDGTGDLVRQIDLDGLLPGIYKLVLRSSNYKYSQTLIVSY